MKTRLFLAILMLLAVAVSYGQVIGIYIDGERRDGRFPPQLRNGRTLMFLRDTFDALNCAVRWYPQDQRIKGWMAETEIELWIGRNTAYVNGEPVTLDQAPILDASGSTLVPLRFISEALGAGVKYTGSSNRVDIDRTTIPYWNETPPFAAGDAVEILDPVAGVWIPAKVLRAFDFDNAFDRYNVEYQEGPPNNRVMRPTLSRAQVRAPRN